MIKADHLIPRRVLPADIDSVRERKKSLLSENRDVPLLERCQRIWDNYSDFRKNRSRDLRFGYGDQLGDIITVDGKQMTYREYLLRTGNFAIQTNQIKNKVDTVVGVMVKEHSEPVCHAVDRAEQQFGEVITEAVQANCRKNRMTTLYKQWMRDVVIGGGLAVAYEVYDDKTGPNRRMDSWSKYINPHTFFSDSQGVDPRGWDTSIIGYFYGLTRAEILSRFATSEQDANYLAAIYPNAFHVFRTEASREIDERFEDGDITWMHGSDPTLCYVCEVWTKESRKMIRLLDTNSAEEEEIIHYDDYEYRRLVKEENEARRKLAEGSPGWSKAKAGTIPYIIGDGYGNTKEERNGAFIEEYWYCRIIAIDGTVLWEGESPYADGLHPFSVYAFPLTDGKITSYMHDAVDLNLAMNRSLVLHDWLTRSQAKGFTVVPRAILPKNVSEAEFARAWTSIDDLVFIDLKPGQEDLFPKTYFSPAQNFDVSNILATYSRLMETGTPVNGAIQGKNPNSGTSGVLYEQMVANSSTPIAALMEGFHEFTESLLVKKMKNIIQFYDVRRFEIIAGKIDSLVGSDLKLERIADIEYDLHIREGSNTPVFREVMEGELINFLNAGFISFEEFLEESARPYADKILQKRQARQAEMEQAAAAQGGVPPEAAAQMPAAGMPPAAPQRPVPRDTPETLEARPF